MSQSEHALDAFDPFLDPNVAADLSKDFERLDRISYFTPEHFQAVVDMRTAVIQKIGHLAVPFAPYLWAVFTPEGAPAEEKKWMVDQPPHILAIIDNRSKKASEDAPVIRLLHEEPNHSSMLFGFFVRDVTIFRN